MDSSDRNTPWDWFRLGASFGASLLFLLGALLLAVFGLSRDDSRMVTHTDPATGTVTVQETRY